MEMRFFIAFFPGILSKRYATTLPRSPACPAFPCWNGSVGTTRRY